MAQVRTFEFLANDRTFDINSATIGIIQKGVYAGYDVVTKKPRRVDIGQPDAYYIEISHSATGVQENDENGDIMPKKSILVTSQGVKISEDSAIELDITIPSTDTRYDYIICEHDYVPSLGGQQAIYSIVEGDETNSLPSVPNPQNKVVVGVLKTYTDGMIEWRRSEVPHLGSSDIRTLPSRLTAMWSESRAQGIYRPIDGKLTLPRLGNTFEVGEAISTNTQLGKAVCFLQAYDEDFGGQPKSGTQIKLVAIEDIEILDKASLLQMPYVTPTGFKPIILPIEGSITVKQNGVITLIEEASKWTVIDICDADRNSITFANQLRQKNLWGEDARFLLAVKAAIFNSLIQQSLSELLVDNGVIQNGISAGHTNTCIVNVLTNQSILGVQTKFATNAVVTILFKGGEGSVKINESSLPIEQRFISNDNFDYVAKENGFITAVQTSQGLLITQGEKREAWTLPTIPVNIEVSAYGGPLRYKICADGTIKFEGAINAQAGNQDIVLFSLPKSLFKIQDDFFYLNFSKYVFIPPFDAVPMANNRLSYIINGNNVDFSVSQNESAITTFNFNGTYINWK